MGAHAVGGGLASIWRVPVQVFLVAVAVGLAVVVVTFVAMAVSVLLVTVRRERAVDEEP